MVLPAGRLLPEAALFRQVAFLAGACCDSRFPRSSTAPFANPHRCPQPVTASRCCRILFHAGSPAERQLSRTDFRFAPSPRSASLAGPPIHEDMVVHGLCGRVPDSAGNVSPWIASAQTDPNLSAHLHRLPTPPPYLRQMRLSPGQGRRYWMLDEAGALPISLHRE